MPSPGAPSAMVAAEEAPLPSPSVAMPTNLWKALVYSTSLIELSWFTSTASNICRRDMSSEPQTEDERKITMNRGRRLIIVGRRRLDCLMVVMVLLLICSAISLPLCKINLWLGFS